MSGDRPADIAARLREVGCASLVDAVGRRHGHRAHLLPLVSPDRGRPLVGPAATITFLPYRDDIEDPPDFAELFYRAVGPQPEGQVLVLSSGGYPEVSHGGGTKLSRVHNHGLAGVASDGRLRDFAELARFDFSTWCRGEAIRWGGDTVMPHVAGQPVAFDGVCVVPGDYVCIDDSGGVVIPAADVVEVLTEAHRIEAEDSRSTEHIRAERPNAPHRGAR